MKKMLWIDDEDSRMDLAKAIADDLALECVYQPLEGAHSTAEKTMAEFEVIFIDHYFTKKINERSAGSNMGASLCSKFRLCCPDVPIFGISAASGAQLSVNEKSEYDLFATESEYAGLRACGKIKGAVDGFRHLRQLMTSGDVHDGEDFVGIVLAQFGAPPDDLSLMRKILPSCLRSRETYNIHHAFQWMSTKFMQKDGILIKTKSIAAMIGVKEAAFIAKIKPKIRDCRYQGVFAFGDDVFWRSLVFAKLANLTENDGSIPLSHYCEKLANISTEDYAVCERCQKNYTEVIAYEDRTPAARAFPAHLDCSIEVQEGQSLFFDSDYLLKESVGDE